MAAEVGISKKHRPPFGRYLRLVCGRCGAVEREWWSAGEGPYGEVEPERHKGPVPDACPVCSGPLGPFDYQVTLVDPSPEALRAYLAAGDEEDR